MITEKDHQFLQRCVELAKAAVDAGDEPFGSVLVSSEGKILFEDHNHVAAGDHTQHPEFAIARWAGQNMTLAERQGATVYTSGEHCPMCAAAHGWAQLGRIVYASSTEQLVVWLSELGVKAGKVKPLRITDVISDTVVEGPVEPFASQVRELHIRFHSAK
ncbi:tRNA(Arg) A34 adenosine deaminase TadA [Paenochrobactrum gallinarii]|uniref:tRNA(Arg) A34 adenosine deaminase TadA n=1 Tax=Paenochrobactrum gallinarii TaxID=643673 RepID=A0A841M077_9HYPH|nr:nucleoside deaminase [Paenochrobactrum gallinarii]MBB6259781.1 tRNA(Arg) A34 adenosine deaminase TadA [Paenochrobactrum gallinarii]